MENNSDVSSSLAHSHEAAVLRSSDVTGNPYLAGGVLLGTSLLGLVTIIWAFWYQSSNLSDFKRTCIMFFTCQSISPMSVQVVYTSLVSLLIMDALNLIVAIILGAEMVRSSCHDVDNCLYVELVWSLSRWFGVIIHLMNAWLSIRYLCQPQSVVRVRSVNLYICLKIVILVPLYVFFATVAIFVFASQIFVFALSVIARSPASTLSPSTATLKKLIVVVAMCTLMVVYIPPFILQCLIYISHDYDELKNYQVVYAYVLVFTNCHLIFDGLQCALFLKLPSGETEQQQQHQQQQQQQEQEQQRQQQQWQQLLQQQQLEQQQWQQQQQQQQQQLGLQNQGSTMSRNVNQ